VTILVDTSAWIEWLIGSTTAKELEARWPELGSTLVPTLVQHELAKWLRREASEEAADQALAYLEQCKVIKLDTRIALLAADFCAEHKLATADAIIYATTIVNDARLLTCDAHFSNLPGTIFVAKQS
jgi:uncharacterized protein